MFRYESFKHQKEFKKMFKIIHSCYVFLDLHRYPGWGLHPTNLIGLSHDVTVRPGKPKNYVPLYLALKVFTVGGI